MTSPDASDLDRIDLKILQQLQMDGRISNLKLAENVSLSPTAQPSTSRRPSAATPVAITTAWEATFEPLPALSPPMRALQ